MKIRVATPDDAAAIATVHVDTWRHAYRSIFPEDYLAGLSYEDSERMWRRAIGERGRQAGRVFVAEEDGTVFGFASGRLRTRARGTTEYGGELQTLYALPSHQGAGAGKQLVRAVAGCLAELGVSSMFLWVFADNAPARKFYESLGGVLIGEDSFELGGAWLSEVAYGWRDLDSLRGRLTRDQGKFHPQAR